MPLIPTPTPTTPTATSVKAEMLARITSLKAILLSSYQANYRAFWFAKGVTPQQVADQFGTDGAELFARSAALAAFLETQFPGEIPAEMLTVPAGYTVTCNEDGTVTI